MFNVDVTKERAEQVKTITSEFGLQGLKARLVLVLDYSGSMSGLYSKGWVQELVERLVPVAMALDDNQEMELYFFHDGAMRASENVTLKNINGIIDRETRRLNYGTTSYAPVMEMIMEDFSNRPKKSGGFFGGMFGSSKQQEPSSPATYPTLVLFITDGSNDDHRRTETVLRDAANNPVFWQYVGIKEAFNRHETFDFLQKLDDLKNRTVDNADFFPAESIASMSDERLYERLLEEFAGWCHEVKKRGWIS